MISETQRTYYGDDLHLNQAQKVQEELMNKLNQQRNRNSIRKSKSFEQLTGEKVKTDRSKSIDNYGLQSNDLNKSIISGKMYNRRQRN